MASQSQTTDEISAMNDLRSEGFTFFLPLLHDLDLILPDQPFTIRTQETPDLLSSLGVDSLIDELFSMKFGQPPASKASIDALPEIVIGCENDNGDEQCVVCLEEWEKGEKIKEMACKHRFHRGCIEKWLKIHGSCPVCRYEMPVDDDDEKKKSNEGERRRAGIWLGFTFGIDRVNGTN